MKKLLLILLCLPIIGFGQNFIETYGNNNIFADIGRSAHQTSDGGYIITGSTYSLATGSYDTYLIKTDGSGVEQWSKTFGANWDENGFSVQQTTDGGYIIAGEGSKNLIKTDGNGIEQWSNYFAVKARSVQQTTDGGYIIAGSSSYDVCLIKTDSNGDSLWSKTFGGTDDDHAYSVQQTSDGGYIITGQTYSFGNGNSDVFLLKTDGSGIAQWLQTFGGTDYDEGFSVKQTNDGGYIIAGSTRSFGNGSSDAYLIKTDGSGIEQWYYTFGNVYYDIGYSVQQTTDGGYIIAGTKSSSFSPLDKDILLLKVNGSGAYEWDRLGGGTSEDNGYSVQKTDDGGYVIAGSSESQSSSFNVILLKVDANGYMSSTSLQEHTTNKELLKVTDLLGRETKQTNQPLLYIYDDGTVEKRIAIE